MKTKQRSHQGFILGIEANKPKRLFEISILGGF